MDQRHFLRSLFDAAVAAADPIKTIAAHLPEPPKGRTIVIGAGKASAEMARALEQHWPAPRADDGHRDRRGEPSGA